MKDRRTFSKPVLLLLAVLAACPAFPAQTSDEARAPSVTSLSGVTPNWITVLSGNVLCPPARNSLGYVAVEEGRMLCSFSQNGDLIWQKGLSARLKPFVSVGPADMIYLVSRDGDLNMLNPGGLLLWTARTGFSITEAPLSGRDGRIYVRGAKNIACYGIKGVCRWSIAVDSLDTALPVTELNDGSLLAFTTRLHDGKSIAKVVSPFGEVSDDIVFAGKVVQAAATEYGTLLAFSDGGVGLCAEKGGTVYSRWAIPSGTQGISSVTAIATDGFPAGKAAFLTGVPATVIIVDVRTGESLSSFGSAYGTKNLAYKGRTAQGLVLASTSQATCYADDGTVVWNVAFDPRKKWTSVFPTDAGYLAFCTSDWTVEGYRVKQLIGSATASSFRPVQTRPYTALYTPTTAVSSDLMGQAISNELAGRMLRELSAGKFGAKEKDWLGLLTNEMNALNQAWMQGTAPAAGAPPWFRTNVDYAELMLNLAASFGTAAYQRTYVSLIRRVDDPVMLQWIVRNAGKMAYDPDGAMLLELESLLRKNAAKGNEAMLTAICDATFEICRFMGRPAFFARGKTIISAMLGAQYPESVREYAKATLNRFIEIEL